jgi:hypothetical protein
MDYCHENQPIACFIIKKLGVPARPSETPRRKEWKSEHNSRGSLAIAPAYAGCYMLPYHHEPSMNSLLTLHEFYPTPAGSILVSLPRALGLIQADIASQSVILRKSCYMLLTDKAASFHEIQ